MAPPPKKPLTVVLTQEQKKFLHKYFDEYVESPAPRERRAIANKAADGLIAQFSITKKEDAVAIRSVSGSI